MDALYRLGFIPITFNVTASGNLGTPQVYTQGVQWTPSAKNADFALASGSTCTGPVTAGSTCTVNVTFNPKYAGLRSGSLRLTDSNGNVLASVPVYGYGQTPLVAFSHAPNLLRAFPSPSPIPPVSWSMRPAISTSLRITAQ